MVPAIEAVFRYVVGWMIANRESAELAKRLIGRPAADSRSRTDNSPSMPIAPLR